MKTFIEQEICVLNNQIERLIDTREKGGALTDVTNLLAKKIDLLGKLALIEAVKS